MIKFNQNITIGIIGVSERKYLDLEESNMIQVTHFDTIARLYNITLKPEISIVAYMNCIIARNEESMKEVTILKNEFNYIHIY